MDQNNSRSLRLNDTPYVSAHRTADLVKRLEDIGEHDVSQELSIYHIELEVQYDEKKMKAANERRKVQAQKEFTSYKESRLKFIEEGKQPEKRKIDYTEWISKPETEEQKTAIT